MLPAEQGTQGDLPHVLFFPFAASYFYFKKNICLFIYLAGSGLNCVMRIFPFGSRILYLWFVGAVALQHVGS